MHRRTGRWVAALLVLCLGVLVALVPGQAGASTPLAASRPAVGKVKPIKSASVSTTDSAATLKWSIPKAKGYKGLVVRYAAGATAPKSVKKGKPGPKAAKKAGKATITGLTPGSTYGISLFAKYAGGRYAKPKTLHAITAPGSVEALTVTATGPNSAALRWQLPAGHLSGITIRRNPGTVAPTTPRVGTVVANLSASTTTFNDTTLSAGTTYSYAVFAQYAGAFSTAAIASVTTPGPADVTAPGPVTGLSASVTSSTVTLTWTNPADSDLHALTIRRASGAAAPESTTAGALVVQDSPTATTFTDTALTAGETYSYGLFALDAAGNAAPAATIMVTLPTGTDPDDAGVVPLPTTVEPASNVVQAVTDNGDGTYDVILGSKTNAVMDSAARPAARMQAHSVTTAEAATTGLGAGGDPCVILGILNANATPKAGAIILVPSAKDAYGVMNHITSATSDLSGQRCDAKGTPASIDQAYSAFDPSYQGLTLGKRFSGDAGVADKTALPFGCTGETGTYFTIHGDFSDTHANFKAHLNAVHPSQSTVSYKITASPVFTADFAVTGSITCSPEPGDLGLYIPIPGTPLDIEFKPYASLKLQGSVTGTVSWQPTFTVSSDHADNQLQVPTPTVSSDSNASFDASMGLSVSLMAAHLVGITGTIGPDINLPNLPDACGTFTLQDTLAVTAHLLFTGWSYTIATYTPVTTPIGGCSQATEIPILKNFTASAELDPDTHDVAWTLDWWIAGDNRLSTNEQWQTGMPASYINFDCEDPSLSYTATNLSGFTPFEDDLVASQDGVAHFHVDITISDQQSANVGNVCSVAELSISAADGSSSQTYSATDLDHMGASGTVTITSARATP